MSGDRTLRARNKFDLTGQIYHRQALAAAQKKAEEEAANLRERDRLLYEEDSRTEPEIIDYYSEQVNHV